MTGNVIKKLNRRISIEKLQKKKFDSLELDGEWANAIGCPEASGVWIIWGNSGNGKTRFALKLAKYLTNFDTVIYDTLEEGARKSMQYAIAQTGIKSVSRRFVLLDREPFEELKQRLRNRKSPSIIFIDSFQYLALTKKQYIDLKKEFPNKLFIFISHAEGKNPEGKVAKFIRYDVDVKIRVEGYVALPVSRYGGGKPFVISKQKSEQYWGERGLPNE